MIEDQNTTPSRIRHTQYVSNDYVIPLANPVTHIEDFSEEMAILHNAHENDVVHFEICSPGGDLDTALILRRGIANTRASVVAWIGPTCASAATLIALACDGWEIDSYSSFMIHTATFGVPPMKAMDVGAFTTHSLSLIEDIVRETYAGFLTEDEIVQVIGGKELYFRGQALADRLNTYDQWRRAQAEQLDTEPTLH